jgi:CRISPR system Cascade subunit CasA
MEKAFNLLVEPWIRTLDTAGAAHETSLVGALRDAHKLRRIAGELDTQDVALLRLLLAVLYAVFSEVDENGNFSPLDAEIDGKNAAQNALNRWRALWERGNFPMEPIEEYLRHFEERFWLFHPQTPFYQVAGLTVGTSYTAAKLFGDLSESGNKPRLFAVRSGIGKESMAYGEAARWLIYLNAFDDNSAKPTRGGEKKVSVGMGYLGKLGLVFATGNSLFETLMLNLILEPRSGSGASWEKPICGVERREIPTPETYAELFTLQSRRILLKRENERVTGFTLLGGDKFETDNAFIEPMTLWRKDAKSTADIYKPRRHNPSKSLWRDFAALTANTEGTRPPGVVSWVAVLDYEGVLNDKHVAFQTASAKYDDKGFFVEDVFSDSVTVNADILSSAGSHWVTRICDVLDTTEKCVTQLKYFVRKIEVAKGYSDDRNAKDRASVVQATEQAYFDMDIPFRQWLRDINPRTDDPDERTAQWLGIVRKLLLLQGRQVLRDAGDRAFTGDKNAITALITFEKQINKLTKGGTKNEREQTA